jgi:hypothetical protein
VILDRSHRGRAQTVSKVMGDGFPAGGVCLAGHFAVHGGGQGARTIIGG